MRKFLRTILRILDGSPNIHMATRNRQRGQSLLELAFITPLLAILIAGASEVGWYTNRWLSLLEVTRVGARSATFLNDGLSAPQWDDRASIAPPIQTDLLGRATTEETYWMAQNSRDCDTGSNFGFYSFIVCLMVESLDPLALTVDPIDPTDSGEASVEEAEADLPSYDDIVISVFAIQPINNVKWRGSYEANNEGLVDGRPIYDTFETPPQNIDPDDDIYKISANLNDWSSTEYPPGRQSVVVGRYPVNANECNYTGGNNAVKTIIAEGDPGWAKDPFDYLDNDAINGAVTNRQFGADPNNSYSWELSSPEGDSLADNEPEVQRGWSLTGQHRIDSNVLFCYGSEFSVRDVEVLVNMPNFIEPDIYNPPNDDKLSAEYLDWQDRVYATQDERSFFEPQGLTLVEIFWQHDLLLDFPLFRPLQESFGEGDIVIALWSAFPLPSVAPNITYQLP